jgi:hypothetical protein
MAHNIILLKTDELSMNGLISGEFITQNTSQIYTFIIAGLLCSLCNEIPCTSLCPERLLGRYVKSAKIRHGLYLPGLGNEISPNGIS